MGRRLIRGRFNVGRRTSHRQKREIKANNTLKNKMVTDNMKNNKQLFYTSIYSDTSDDEVTRGKKTHDDNKKVDEKASTIQSCAFCECLSTNLPYDEKILKIAETAASLLSRLVEESGRKMPKSNEVTRYMNSQTHTSSNIHTHTNTYYYNAPFMNLVYSFLHLSFTGFTNLNTNKSNRMSMTQVKRCITLYCGFCKTKLSGKIKLDSGLNKFMNEELASNKD
ncbi:hypothetical protein TSAR_012607 [Trichomalopsis sarcophagae]|uniref:Uncharacterized protein n=1 Tax=Trichomalopsis sarcophagae TaxID=543379 RepID=A0A232EFP7_9HYME|nr:hypothetical protein TSAR_012607 [Trichomalopsis sarcophagae]